MDAIIAKAKSIRLAIFDVDGVLTSGKLIYGPTGIEYKTFNVHDGQGLKFLQKSGVELAIITACRSDIIHKRMQDLDIEHVYRGVHDKTVAYQELKEKLQLQDEQIAYTGDDLPDLPLIRRAGLGIAVANAMPILKEHAAFITRAQGGKGAVREICELIMQAQGTYTTLLDHYLQR